MRGDSKGISEAGMWEVVGIIANGLLHIKHLSCFIKSLHDMKKKIQALESARPVIESWIFIPWLCDMKPHHM